MIIRPSLRMTRKAGQRERGAAATAQTPLFGGAECIERIRAFLAAPTTAM